MSAPLLTVRGLRVQRAGRRVLALDELALGAGEVVAVVGENGSGKSTLLLAAAGLLDLEAGEVRLASGPVHRGRAPAGVAFRRGLVLSLQEPYPFAGPVLEQAAFGLLSRGVAREARLARARAALAELGLASLAGRAAQSLSGGERKLLALAQVIALEPVVALLDEPSAGVDREHLPLLEGWVARARGRGAALLLATHDRALAARLADRTIALREGRVAEAST